MSVKKVVILGGGESGYGSAILADKKGYDVFLSDKGRLSDKYRNLLLEANISFEEGEHTAEKILDADIIIKSPGIPEKAAIIVAAKAKGIKIVSEIEFAGQFCKAKIVSITGSNGKTTTATLTHKILSEGGVNVALAGNIGDSFALSVAQDSADWYVLELSSFQLDGCYTFRSDIAVLTNITPDHLDRYDYNLSLYGASKFRVAQNQGEEDMFIMTANDINTMEFIGCCESYGRKIFIAPTDTDREEGGFLSKDMSQIICRLEGREVIIDRSDLKIDGLHNCANIMDSVLVAMKVGVDSDSIIESVTSFGGVEHRMEFVAEIDGVTYINDSKATNVDSTWYALESMTKPVIWIAGGTDKGNDYSPLIEFASRSVKALVCMGLDNNKLKESFKGVVPAIYDTASLDEMFTVVRDIAQSGDTVLLSPCCASFDLFSSYEDRGRQFKSKITSINK